MLTLEDCLAMSDLTEEEILAIAEHEHIPEMAALELGHCLCHSADGEHQIECMIREDIEASRQRGDIQRAAALATVLEHFAQRHPAR